MTIHLSRALRPEGHLAEVYWRMRVAELGSACCISEPAGEADGIREAFHLLMLAPPGPLSQWKVRGSQERIEAMLAAGAGESAALSILPPDAGYMLSRGANGEHLASVFLAGADHEMTSHGATAALALVAALMAELSQWQSPGEPYAASIN